MARYDFTAVAFVRSVGGVVRLLLAVDVDGEQRHDGEPAVLVELRPGADPSTLLVELADAAAPEYDALVRSIGADVAALIDRAFAPDGTFDGSLMLGTSISARTP